MVPERAWSVWFEPFTKAACSSHWVGCVSGKGRLCLVSIYPEEEWRKDFEALLRRVHRRSRRPSGAVIEEEITAARAEVRTKRREARRSA